MHLLRASNANEKKYGTVNQPSHFFTELPSEISLDDGDYEIALKEIIYSSRIPTIIDEGVRVLKPLTDQQGALDLEKTSSGDYFF